MERTKYQEGVIKRYYEHMPEIMRQKLGELVTELYLATTDKKREQLWKRVEQALKNLRVPDAQIENLISKADPALLATFIEKHLGAI
ncbi:MAG: hypothetical protein IJM54_11860 [Thermoguttaceae bacterium]|jgi:hypothetical protein|nr:hypothetical protein [Thermoguttaceae bacterium]MBR4752428.1 hypothetical protein [Thermoguttaceae bacterium]MBR5757020.1 hypothetical protein [Thermoguttaceae bacterium]